MRIIFLNSWYGQVGNKYFEFMESQSFGTEIYYLQEITPDLFLRLERLLPNHKGFFLTQNMIENLGFLYGKAVFVNKDFKVREFGIQHIHKETPKDCGFSQPIDIETKDETLHINSVHGKTFPGNKLDTPARLKQSEILIDYFKDKTGPKIIGGDFNLYPDTKSVKMFEEAGYRNLINDFRIKNTRNRICWDFHKNDALFVKQYFADYCFVSPEVKVKSFEVPKVEVSDHEPLILDFEI